MLFPFPITTPAHLVCSYIVIIKSSYLEACIIKVNREFPRSTDKRKGEVAFFVFRYVIAKSILFRQQLYITSGELQCHKPLAYRTKRKHANVFNAVSVSSIGFICLLDNVQYDSVFLAIKNFILSKRSRKKKAVQLLPLGGRVGSHL